MAGNESPGKRKRYIYFLLVDLVRQQEVSNEHHRLEDALARDEAYTAITVALGVNVMAIQLDEILSTFWGTALNTDCEECGERFRHEPPLRTISRNEAISVTSGDSPHARIHNRHLACLLSSGTLFIPVSHAWEDSVRQANGSCTYNDEATLTLVQNLSVLLKSSEDAYPPTVEFWHGYFSVPQWEQNTKERWLVLLLKNLQ